jgi:translation initiation factor IF-2
MTPKKKPEKEENLSKPKKPGSEAETKKEGASKPAVGTPVETSAPATPEAPAKKRMVLKTLKRAATGAPQSPTLHKVSGVMTRRVLPKAPPPKPVPPPPKVEEKPPAPPVDAKPVQSAPPPPQPTAPLTKSPPAKVAPAAAPSVPPAVPIVKKVIEKRKEPAKSEPTATYKMPAAPVVKPPTGKSAAKPAHAPTPAVAPAPGDTAAAEAVRHAQEAPAAGRQKVRIAEVVTVKDLAAKLNVKSIDVIKKLLSLGSLVTINQQIDADVATLAADAFGFDVEIVPILQEPEKIAEIDDPAALAPRPPVVTIMGHVDHGKTSLLDAIRKTRVAEKEAGGITQHIGAYRVSTSKGEVVFLDTPGHEAFTAMRARGAQVTDIVVLVVAADDGVMPQTIEAIDHARAANVLIVVAVNKVDLPTADPEKIRRALSTHQLVPEEWGGKTIFVDVSAKKGTNIDKLLEMLSLEAELMELKANPHRSAQGVVVEAKLDPRRGVAATLLVQKGTLKMGEVVVAGVTYGRARALLDDKGGRLQEAGPSTPVEVLGLSAVPQAGDRFTVMSDEREARTLVERRQLVLTEETQRRRRVTLENLHEHVAEGKVRELRIVLKADVQGSVQALRDSLERMSTDEIRLQVIHSGVGGINETDVSLAAASDAIIIGFNVRPDGKADEVARREEVEIKTYRIIYEAIADVRAAMEGLLEPETTEVKLGRAEIRQVFKMSKGGTIGGSLVVEGKLTRGGKVRVVRDGVVVHEGTIDSLKRFKDDVKEVDKGFECGIGLGNFQDIKANDILEAYTQETKARKLEPAS